MSWLETVFGLLCDDKSRRQLLCCGKRGLMMQRVSKKLQRLLRASPCPVYVQVKAHTASALNVLHALKQLSTWARVTGLDLSAMGACDVAARRCPDVIVPLVKAHSKSLEVLNLNGIQMGGVMYNLIRAHDQELGPLAECTSLTHLDLSDPGRCNSRARMKYLARVLPHMTSLQTLIVRSAVRASSCRKITRIQTEGAKELAEALDECPSVSLVDVSDNDLQPEGREALEAAFRKRDASHRLIVDE